MSSSTIAFYRKKINQIGRWVGVRHLRNKGVTFEQAYFILFDRLPRVQYR